MYLPAVFGIGPLGEFAWSCISSPQTHHPPDYSSAVMLIYSNFTPGPIPVARNRE